MPKVNYINQKRAPTADSGGVNPSNAFNTIYNLPFLEYPPEFEDDVDEQGNMIWYDASKNPQGEPCCMTVIARTGIPA